jgi:hypothetical protein
MQRWPFFNQSRWTITTAADDASTADEVKVLKSLQWSTGQKTDAPLFTEFFQPGVGSTATTYRLRWNGKSFLVLEAGTAGSGLVLDQSTGDMKTTKVSLTGFSPDAAAN